MNDRLDVDLYGMGQARRGYWYPSFGLIKMLVSGSETCENAPEETGATTASRAAWWMSLDPRTAIDGMRVQQHCVGACGHRVPIS